LIKGGEKRKRVGDRRI